MGELQTPGRHPSVDVLKYRVDGVLEEWARSTPRTEPCGTPHVTGLVVISSPVKSSLSLSQERIISTRYSGVFFFRRASSMISQRSKLNAFKRPALLRRSGLWSLTPTRHWVRWSGCFWQPTPWKILYETRTDLVPFSGLHGPLGVIPVVGGTISLEAFPGCPAYISACSWREHLEVCIVLCGWATTSSSGAGREGEGHRAVVI